MYIKFFRQTRSILRRVFIAMLIFLLALLYMPVQPALAASMIVTNTADDLTTGNGCSLREAIINANDDAATYPDCPAGTGNDVITLTSGATYTLSLVAAGATGGDLNITDPDGLTIQASGATSATIDANDIDRVLEVTEGNLTIDHITITDGTATQGGGIFVTTTGILTINNSSILDNTGTNAGWCGGGIYNNGIATININNTTFAGNSCIGAGSVGGGMYKRNTNGQLNISNSTFYNNSAVNIGGGLTVGSGSATISFSTFSNNRATNNGGAIQVTGGTVTITNSILANSTTPVGGSINDCNQFTEFAPAPAVVTLDNSIVEVNSNCAGTIFSSNDPGLGSFQNNGGPTSTMAITATSNAYNNAASCGSLSADQRGVSRPQATSCDIGAYELDNNAPSITSFTRQNPATSPTNADTLVFRATFSEDVKNVGTADFAVNSTSTATVTSVSQVTASTYDITVSGGDLAGYNGTVNLNLSGSQDITDLAGNALPAGEPSTDETYTVDNTAPTVTINQAAAQADPTNASPINFTVIFSEAVTGFATGDVTLGGTSGATTATVTGSGTTYNVAVSGMTSDGTVIATIDAGVALDATNNGNSASTSTDNIVTYDTTGPTVTIDQAAAQADPTNISPINFTVVFSEPVTGFTNTDVTLGGTAGATTVVVTEIAPNDGTTYNVAVSGMTNDGTVSATVPAGVVVDSTNNNNVASTSTDNTVLYDVDFPIVTGSVPVNNTTVSPGPTQLTMTFSEDVKNDGSAGAANNMNNYLLVEMGTNAAFDTVSCLGGIVADDVQITINNATYTNNGGSGPFTSTLGINGGVQLLAGTYRLFICGTTSIEDLTDRELNDGVSDTIIDFTVIQQQTNESSLLPKTGFPQNMVTALPLQHADLAYVPTGIWLEIPKLGVKMSIVGVPQTDNGWDVTWLDKNAGWLNGSAFPTISGNSVITGHVWDALNRPGPFAKLRNLHFGDQIKIHAFGQIYTYEVRESTTILPTNTHTVFKHEENSWVSLITCEDYLEATQIYTHRRLIRAVLVNVSAE